MSPQIAGPRRCKVTLITFVSPHGLIGCDSKDLFELYKGKPQQKKPFFSPKCGWVGWLIHKPLKTPQNPPNHPENRPFRPKFHLSFSQISQKTWGGWVGSTHWVHIWERSPKKTVFFGSFPDADNDE